MTKGLKPKSKISIYIYPVFMLKRLALTLIVLIFYNMPALQILSLINLQFVYLIFIIKTRSSRELRQFVVDIFNETCLLMMFYHLYIFGDSGIVNGTDNQISIDARIQFIQNFSISFDIFGILIIIFNFSSLAISLGQEINLMYEECRIEKVKELK